MLSKKEKEQYARQISLNELGIEKQEMLKKSSVLVVGVGGLGCSVLQYLASMGIGEIGIIDPNNVNVSNLHRQILYTHDDVGKPKAKIAKKRLKSLNPYINIKSYVTSLNEENALSILEKYDLIIVSTDNFVTKYLTNDACVIKNKPFILGSIFKFEGQLSVFNYQGSATYRCLFPDPSDIAHIPTYKEVGVLGVLPGVVGTLMANEAVKAITGLGNLLTGKLLKFNILKLRSSVFEFEKNINIRIDKLVPIEIIPAHNLIKKEISYETILKEPEAYHLLDIRPIVQHNKFYLGGLHIPFEELKIRKNELPKDKPIVVYCNKGVSSVRAVNLLNEICPDIVFYNLKNGIENIKL